MARPSFVLYDGLMSTPIDDVKVPGWNFDAWPADSSVTLVNVPWSNTYRDVVRFEDGGALNRYIDSRVKEEADVLTSLSYIPTNRPIRLHDPENRFYKYNYLRVRNNLIPGSRDTQRDYYYFITDVAFVNGDTTMITVQLDVFQTFIYDVTFGNCYVERGHIAMANSRRFDAFGRTHLTLAEGLETGSDYVNVAEFSKPLVRPGAATSDYLVCSIIDLGGNWGEEGSINVPVAPGSTLQGARSGASYYIVQDADLINFLLLMRSYPWIAQGIISITAVPKVTRYYPSFAYPNANSTSGRSMIKGVPASYHNPISYYLERGDEEKFRDVLRQNLPDRYKKLDKLLTYPYSVVELTTSTGTPLELRPENWPSEHLEVQEMMSFHHPGQKIAVYPKGYNSGGRSTGTRGDDLDRATVVSSLPQVAIANDQASLALANQAHSIAYSRESSDWSQQKSLRGNALSYDQAQAGSALQNNLLNLQQANERQNQQASAQWANDDAFMGTAKSAGMGALGGSVAGPIGTVVGGVGGLGAGLLGQLNAGMQGNRSAETLANNQRTQSMGNMLSQANDRATRDTNKSLSDWAAKGDYENTIAGINAKIQDTQATPPSVVGQMGGEMFNFVSAQGQNIKARLKRIDDAHVTLIGEYWLRYGYAINRFMRPTNLHAMSRFTYWKMSETYIGTSPMPETYKQAIRGIFEKGVTVWRNAGDIGMIDTADNTPSGGISY